MKFSEILRDSNYKLIQFNFVEIQNPENRIEVKNGNEIPNIECAIRKKHIRFTPEETALDFIDAQLKKQ